MRNLILLMLMLLICFPTHADDDDYQLREPDIDEFLAALPEIWEHSYELLRFFDEGAYGLHLPEQLIRLLETEFTSRYDETVTVEQGITAYDALNRGEMFGYANYMPFIDQQAWNLRIVRQWLDENNVDLTRVEQLRFGPYTIDISRHHLTNLEEADVLLRVSRDGYVDHWIGQPEGDGFRLRLGPVNYLGSGYWQSQPNGTLAEVTVRDVNMDGLEEIISKQSNAFPGSGYYSSRTTFTVNGSTAFLQSRSVTNDTGDVSGDIPQWQFENIDDDAPLELIQNDYGRDNFFCLQHRRQVFDWDGDIYAVISDETDFEETVGCAIRLAQAAMWNHDYEEAIDHFELALERFSGDFAAYDGQRNRVEQFAAYAQERLFIAYMLAGDTESARDLLDDLREQPLIENTIAQQLIALPEDQLDALTVCETAHNFIEGIRNEQEQNYRNLPNLGFIEETIHIYASWGIGIGPPEKVGCDIDQLHMQNVTATPSPTPHPTATPDPVAISQLQERNDFLRAVQSMVGAARQGEMADALTYSEAVLRNETFITPESDIALLSRYYRAFALESLNRPDEALDEYVAIYEAAPDSAWGMLAALHFERVEE